MVEFQDTELENIIEMRGISQSYDGGKSYIIQDLSLLVQNNPEKEKIIEQNRCC